MSSFRRRLMMVSRWRVVWTGSRDFTRTSTIYADVTQTINGIVANRRTRLSGKAFSSPTTFNEVELNSDGTNTLLVFDSYDQFGKLPTTNNSLTCNIRGGFLQNRGVTITKVEQIL